MRKVHTHTMNITQNKKKAIDTLCDNGFDPADAQQAVDALIDADLVAYDPPAPITPGDILQTWKVGNISIFVPPDGTLIISDDEVSKQYNDMDKVAEYALALLAAAKVSKETGTLASDALTHVFGTPYVEGSTGPQKP